MYAGILPESGSILRSRDQRLPGPCPPPSPRVKKSGGQALGSRLNLTMIFGRSNTSNRSYMTSVLSPPRVQRSCELTAFAVQRTEI